MAQITNMSKKKNGGGSTLKQARFEEERERIHRQMLSAVSHDLKTPLATMIGSLEVYERMKHLLPPEKSDLLLATALQEAYRLDNFVTNILDMAKLENGMVKLRYENSNISFILKDCIEKSSHRFKGTDIQLSPLDDDFAIHTDQAILCRSIGLLIDNAIKYGGDPVKVVLKATQKDGQALIQVVDNGSGIPEGKEEEIFSKYTRLSRGDHQNAGTGLGLPIARSLASMLNGSLFLSGKDKELGGAVFTLSIPVHA